MPRVTRLKNRFTIQMLKYSPALPVNSGLMVRIAVVPIECPALGAPPGAAGVLTALSMIVPLAGGASPEIRRDPRADYRPNETPRGLLPGALFFPTSAFSGSQVPRPHSPQ